MEKGKSYAPDEYNKLVRNKIPGIIRRDNLEPVAHTARGGEYWFKLLDKLREETEELIASQSIDQMTEELADVAEVIKAIQIFSGIDPRQVEQVRQTKEVQRGSFSKRIILDRVEKP